MQSLEPVADANTNGSNVEQPAQNSVPTANLPSGPSTLVPSLRDRLYAAYTLNNENYVYLIHCPETSLYKIGYSADVKRRLADLQATSAFPMELIAYFGCVAGSERIFESLLHRVFAHCRTHGEWFKLSKEDLEFFSDVNPLILHLCRIAQGEQNRP